MVRFGIIGVPGKMGKRLVELAPQYGRLTLAIGRSGAGRDSGDACGLPKNGVVIEPLGDVSGADVLIEFASAEVTRESVEAATRAKKALLICTTGHDAATRAAIDAAQKDIPVMLAPNTSLGVAVLNAALALALEALGPEYAAEIVEIHHDKKKDAPSGTAIRLTDTIQKARENSVVTTGRVGPRKTEEIGVFAVRGGNVVGEHTVYLIGEHERIELSHRAQSRDLFAAGALRAATWLAGQPAGAYTIEDSLNLQRKRS